MPDFDFAILGAGAMGSIVGGHLARAGHSVVMLARGERAQQLERQGLTIKGLAAFTTPVATLREPAALKRAGALIVAMKTPVPPRRSRRCGMRTSGSRCRFRTGR